MAQSIMPYAIVIGGPESLIDTIQYTNLGYLYVHAFQCLTAFHVTNLQFDIVSFDWTNQIRTLCKYPQGREVTSIPSKNCCNELVILYNLAMKVINTICPCSPFMVHVHTVQSS